MSRSLKLPDKLKDKREGIIRKWVEAALYSHSPQAAKFATGTNQFANPIAFSVSKEFNEIFQELVKALEGGEPRFNVDTTIKIRAVQDFSAVEALSFPFRLKDILRLEFKKDLNDPEFSREFRNLEALIDRLALLSFGRYVDAREQLYQIKIKELKSGVFSNQPDAGCPSALLNQWEDDKKNGTGAGG